MKKILIIFTALLSIILLLGFGYAYLYKNITVSNEVLTGQFNIEFVKDDKYPCIVKIEDYSKGGGGFGERITEFIRGDIKTYGKTIDISIDNIYPGSKADCLFKIKNTGTVPLLIDSVSVNFETSNERLLETMKATLRYYKYNKKEEIYYTKDVSEPFILKFLQDKLNQLLKGEKLKPMEYIKFGVPPLDSSLFGYKDGFKIIFPAETMGNMNSSIKIKIKINAKQPNSMKD